MRSVVIAASLLAAALAPAQVHAQAYSGRAEAVDGDTLAMTGARIRLFGIDAVEKAQTCMRGSESWSCGLDASQALSRLVADGQALCVQQDIDDYGRVVAICHVGGVDLGEAMVRMGYATALPRFSQAYVATEAAARSRKVGIWTGTFDPPAAYRAAHPRDYAQAATSRTAPHRAAPATTTGLHFRNCREAWAAGRAPIYAGQPGYRSEMDGDGDGVACEPFRRR